MSGEEFLDFYTEPVEHIRLKGTRISLDLVVSYFKAGQRPEDIAAHAFAYPIPLAQMYGAIAYYLNNRERVDAYIQAGEERYQRERAENDAKPPSDVVLRLMAIKAQREAAAQS
jgi:uncharacterized protein (DUF433 family)